MPDNTASRTPAWPVRRNNPAAKRSGRLFPVIQADGTITSRPPGARTRRTSLSVSASKIYSEGNVATTLSKVALGKGRCWAVAGQGGRVPFSAQAAASLAGHLAALIQSESRPAALLQGQLQVPGTVTDLENAAIQIRQHALHPTLPAPEGDQRRNKVIRPSELVVKELEKKGQKRAEDGHECGHRAGECRGVRHFFAKPLVRYRL